MKALFELSAVLMPGASLTLFADLGACRVQKSSVTICVLPAPSGWRATSFGVKRNIVEVRFLSTPSGWRATASITEQLYTAMEFLSTPSGWRATDNGVTFWRNGDISIHALRVEGDPAIAKGRCSRSISIHALRVEGDTTACTCIRGSIVDFYPRPPGGGRPVP